MISFVYNTYGFSEKMTSFSFFKYFNAFELDVDVFKFVYYGKTRIWRLFVTGIRGYWGLSLLPKAVKIKTSSLENVCVTGML